MPQGMTPQQWYWMLQQLGMPPASPSSSPGAPGRGERGEIIPGATSSATTPNKPGAGPTVAPEDPNTGFPPAIGGNEPTTAPYNPAFETPNNPNLGWGPPPTNEGMVPAWPQQYQEAPGANLGTPENQIPHDPELYYPSEGENVPTSEFIAPNLEQYYPSEDQNVPTSEGINLYDPPQYYSDVPSNVPTNESMLPAGPNDYLPSEGFNVPTNEAMQPTDLQQYSDSTAGANIPTNESMIADLAPDAFGQSEAPPDTFSYPDGQGDYTTLDSSGNPVASAPADATANDQEPYGLSLSPLTPEPGLGPSTTVGAYGAGGGGGSFFHGNVGAGPIAGSFTNLGGSANAAFEQVPFWQRMMMRQAHATARRGYRSPLIGTGDAVARFASRLGSHARYQGAYSPAARAAALAYPAAAAVGQQGGGGGGNEDRGARGPGGRSMSPV